MSVMLSVIYAVCHIQALYAVCHIQALYAGCHYAVSLCLGNGSICLSIYYLVLNEAKQNE
jgi:hypothetical protein